jgi:hypothetical protein
VLSAREETVLFLSNLLHAERQKRGTRTGRRALGRFAQAVLIVRWFIDGTREAQLAADNAIGGSTAYRYLHEGIDTLAERRPGLHGALLAAKAAKKPAAGRLTDDQKTTNLIDAHLRSRPERANSLLKTTFKALRRVSLCPWRIGAIVAAALVLLHREHGRTT